MEKIPCCHCGRYFERSARHKNQIFCMLPECRRARKSRWQRQKMASDPEYRANQRASQQKWLKSNPAYWKTYRARKPEKAERNRHLQTIRNRKRRQRPQMPANMIAKMDASIPNKFEPVGQFWVVPVIAKMDALKVNLYEIPPPYS